MIISRTRGLRSLHLSTPLRRQTLHLPLMASKGPQHPIFMIDTPLQANQKRIETGKGKLSSGGSSARKRLSMSNLDNDQSFGSNSVPVNVSKQAPDASSLQNPHTEIELAPTIPWHKRVLNQDHLPWISMLSYIF